MAKRTYARKVFLSDVLTTAAEGGVNYWGHVEAHNWADERKGEDPAESEFDIWVPEENVEDTGTQPREYRTGRDGERYGVYHVDIDTIAKGFNFLGAGKSIYMHPDVVIRYRKANKLDEYGEYDEDGWIDSDAADNIVQAGLFGEVIFG